MIRRHIVGEYNCPLRMVGQWVQGRLVLRYEETELPSNGHGLPLVMSKLKHYPGQSIVEPFATPDMDTSHVLKIYPVRSDIKPELEWVERIEQAEDVPDAEGPQRTNVALFLSKGMSAEHEELRATA